MNERKRTQPNRIMGYHQVYQHRHYKTPRKIEKGAKRIFKEIMTEYFPNLRKGKDLYVKILVE